MTEPTAEQIQRACDLSPYELACLLAAADAEAERVRKVAEKGLRIAQRRDALPTNPMPLIAGLFKSLLPAEPEVDPLVEACREAFLTSPGSADSVARECAEAIRAALARQGKVIKIEDRP